MITFKQPQSETNDSPSIATFEPINPNSVRSRLSDDQIKNMPTNGHTTDSLREFSQISKHDDIDKIGIATRLLSDSAAKYSKSQLHASLMKRMQSISSQKPK